MSARLNLIGTRHVIRLFESGTVAGLSESELIDRFVIRRDPVAFEALVVRHGPMVLGVCRRFLHDPNDIDDAFQATFLVLVEKAARLRDRERLASWLHGVARHVSRKARAQRLRNGAKFGKIDGELCAPIAAEHPLSGLLDDELARMPSADRLAIVLCDLNGLTGDEAAQSLGIRAVAFRSRLHRARMRLKSRLERRGIVGGAGITTLTLSAMVPDALAAATVKSALAYAVTSTCETIVPLSVLTLTHGAIRSMMLTKFQTAAAALTVAMGFAGAAVLAQAPAAAPPAPTTQPYVATYPAQVVIPAPPGVPAGEADRLREVEAKLDRILSALDGDRTSLTVGRSLITTKPKTATVTALPVASAAPEAVASYPMPKPTPPLQANAPRFTPTPGAAPPVNGTLTVDYARIPVATNQQLEQLENRIKDLEKKVRSLEQALERPTEDSNTRTKK